MEPYACNGTVLSVGLGVLGNLIAGLTEKGLDISIDYDRVHEGVVLIGEVDLTLVVRILNRGQPGRDLWSLPDTFTFQKVLLQVHVLTKIRFVKQLGTTGMSGRAWQPTRSYCIISLTIILKSNYTPRVRPPPPGSAPAVRFLRTLACGAPCL